MTGQPSAALTAAIGHYQKKKGFPSTGRLDPETCGSLGIGDSLLPPASPPFVVVNSGEARGPNGEALPLTLSGSNPNRTTEFDHLLTDRDHVVLSLLDSVEQSRPVETSSSKPRPSRGRVHRAAQHKETNPFVMAFRSVDHAMKRLLGDTPTTKKKNVASKRL